MSIFESASPATASSNARAKPVGPAPCSLGQRLQIEQLMQAAAFQSVLGGADIIHGLTQIPKTLPAHYFYDDRGSELFEQICGLPEYYPTRTETAILQAYALAIATTTGPCELVELGSGSATKTRLLLDACDQLGYALRYMPIDVSGGMLERSALDLLGSYPELQVHGLVGSYELALNRLPPTRLPSRMVCFLGSTLGNLNPQECQKFFSQITAALQPGEYFLLGIDLQKSQHQLEAAYNDAAGVTAEFNLNMLRHLNQRYGGDFDLNQFQHWAFYNQSEQQIEMHLKSLCEQTVQLKTLELTVELKSGETIHTEISRKFSLSDIQQELQIQGLRPLQVWTDPQNWFGLLLCQSS